MPPMPPQQAVGVGGGGKANPNSRTSSTTMSQMTGSTFSQLPLSAPTQRAIAEVLGYQTLTKVQNDSIPPALAGEFSFLPLHTYSAVGWLICVCCCSERCT